LTKSHYWNNIILGGNDGWGCKENYYSKRRLL
jgi:hypothetical protein